MKQPNKGGRRVVPQPGGVSNETVEAGPPVEEMRMPPPRTQLRWVASEGGFVGEPLPPMTAEEWEAHCEREDVLFSDRPLVPTAEEIAKLPRSARAAFARRCAARVARLLGADGPAELDPRSAVHLLLDRATAETPIRRQLLCIRRDFDRLRHLARKENWTDDTPVPPEVFGPMWPAGLTPDWARETPPEPV
jgi:hypothetical protein